MNSWQFWVTAVIGGVVLWAAANWLGVRWEITIEHDDGRVQRFVLIGPRK